VGGCLVLAAVAGGSELDQPAAIRLAPARSMAGALRDHRAAGAEFLALGDDVTVGTTVTFAYGRRRSICPVPRSRSASRAVRNCSRHLP